MTMQPVLEHEIVAARRALHVVGEYLLAGPQHRTSGTIRLHVTDTGFATVREMPGSPSLAETAATVMGASAATQIAPSIFRILRLNRSAAAAVSSAP